MALGNNRRRLMCMLSLTFAFFIVEVVVSRMTASLAMLSDSFHMLSDVIALVVALVAVRFAQVTQATSKNTFGWIRAEVMGALVNAIFLTALSFTVLLEAVERYTVPHEIENSQVVIWVGLAGLLVNLLGLLMFHGHAGHGHSHSGHSHKINNRSYEKSDRTSRKGSTEEEVYDLMVSTNNAHSVEQQGVQIESDIIQRDCLDFHVNGNISLEELEQSPETATQLNMRGVFLHVLGDALGSVIVVVNALIFTYVWKPCKSGEVCINPCYHSHCPNHQHVNATQAGIPGNNTTTFSTAGPCWVLYLDPSLCVIMVSILLYTTFPLLKESALILLQTVPKQINLQRLNGKLKSLEGVLAVHELHVWQLAGSRIIATAHVKCDDPASYMDVAKRIKGFFHDEGIHATTIQPEFATGTTECELSCRIQCAPKLCCSTIYKCVPQPTESLSLQESSRDNSCGDIVTLKISKDQKVIVQTEMESAV
ncbi:zinc transporter 1 [Chanos chanos]|uniref:Zinc transporter 1 n=1 Tax=Chanos chanos TaxID=29144 RepID=A0AC58UVX3_CHACN